MSRFNGSAADRRRRGVGPREPHLLRGASTGPPLIGDGEATVEELENRIDKASTGPPLIGDGEKLAAVNGRAAR